MAGESRFELIGRFLFRHRALAGFAGYLVAFWLGRPTPASCAVAAAPFLAGLGLRFWAMGYIGGAARAGEVGAERLVKQGPYRLFKTSRRAPAGHPLYFGNFLLVVAMLVALWPPVLLGLLVVGLFLVMYGTIARAEERLLARRFRDAPVEKTAFELRRTGPELATWAVSLAGYGFALAKALLWSTG